MPGRYGAGGGLGGEQGQPAVDPPQQLPGRQDADLSGGELDGQGQPVELRAQGRHRGQDVVGQLEGGYDEPGPVGEQPYRRAGAHVLVPGTGTGVGVRDGERADRVQRLAGDPQRLPARRQYPQLPAGAQQGGEPVRAPLEYGFLPYADRRHDRVQDVRPGCQRAQVDPPRPAPVRAPDAMRELQRQPGLAHPGRPDQCHQPVAGQPRAQVGELDVTAHERVEAGCG